MFWARFCRQARNAFIGVCLIGGHGCSKVLDGCTEMLGLLSRHLANVRQKRKIFSFSVGNATVQKRRLYTATLAHLPKKMELRLAAIRKENHETHIVLEMLLSSSKLFFKKIYQKDIQPSKIYENYFEAF